MNINTYTYAVYSIKLVDQNKLLNKKLRKILKVLDEILPSLGYKTQDFETNHRRRHVVRKYIKLLKYFERLYESSGSGAILSQTSIFNSIHYKCLCLSILQMMHYFRPTCEHTHTHTLSGLKKRRSGSRFHLFTVSCSAFLSAGCCAPELCDPSLRFVFR